MKAPIGAEVGLYYDSPRMVQVGDVLRTPTGRTYLLSEVRRQQCGRHAGRWHLRAIVVECPPDGARIHPLYWYRRDKKRPAGLPPSRSFGRNQNLAVPTLR